MDGEAGKAGTEVLLQCRCVMRGWMQEEPVLSFNPTPPPPGMSAVSARIEYMHCGTVGARCRHFRRDAFRTSPDQRGNVGRNFPAGTDDCTAPIHSSRHTSLTASQTTRNPAQPIGVLATDMCEPCRVCTALSLEVLERRR